MSCGCLQEEDKKNPEPTINPTSEFKQPTEILPGENIDCYAKRAGTNGKNDVAEKVENKIDNTSIATDLEGNVSEQFKLTPNSNRTATVWKIKINGEIQHANSISIQNLQFSNGLLSGKVSRDYLNKQYTILVIAEDSAGEIDSREFNFFPKAQESKSTDTIKFVFPYSGNGRVTCSFGPRKPPAPGASSMHKGIDISQPGSSLGYILSAADGTVSKCGPASGYGNLIVIEHRDKSGNLVATTGYGHMNEIYVAVGQKVSAGQKIAKEGNAGVGSAAHLHFELHKGQWGNPVDPIPYLNGQFAVAGNNLPNQNGVPDEATYAVINNSKRGMTTMESDKVNTNCPNELPNQQSVPNTPEPPQVPINPSTEDTQLDILQALDEDAELDEEDKKILMFMAKIESNFKPTAKNPVSSARGIYQMLDKTAIKYYADVGIPATQANRENAYYATKAQIEFYKKEQRRYWLEYQSSKDSANPTIAGKRIDDTINNKYRNLSKGEFIYGLIHHDGVGNAIAGKDLQGLDYYRRKIREA